MISQEKKCDIRDRGEMAGNGVPLPSYEEATASKYNTSPSPQPMHVISHLKLLHAFHKLKENVLSDQTFLGIDDSWLPTGGPEHADTLFEAHKIIAQKRWDVYVKRAVLRFEDWWSWLHKQIGAKGILIQDLARREQPFPPAKSEKIFALSGKTLPPLDVLMVWHSFLLSPRRYLEDCLVQGMTTVWQTNFPWAEIDRSTDVYGNYSPDSACEVQFAQIRPWRQTDDDCLRCFTCPGCEQKLYPISPTRLPAWIKITKEAFEKQSLDVAGLLDDIEQAILLSQGWCDESFVTTCFKCSCRIDRDVLCAHKFIKEVTYYQNVSRRNGGKYCPRPSTFSMASLLKSFPMPGTVLNSRTGLVHIHHTQNPTDLAKLDHFFPIVLAETISHVDSNGDIETKPTWTKCTMQGVRQTLQSALDCPKQMLYATNKAQRRAKKSQRLTIRKMMSYYNDNPSIHSLDLASAVHRQSVFIEKMQHIDWLHSPALPATASRVIVKYQNFIQMIAEHPSEMAVPTLDIDLAWHTHQLTPSSYYKYSVSRTGKFIDHDDKVSSHKLSESFARTSRNYQRLFNEPYSECTCWYCEAMHASVPKYPGRFMLPNRAKGYRRPGNAADDHAAAHISAHNVVRIQDAPGEYRTKARQHLLWLETAHQRACERAKKEGRPPPARRHAVTNNDSDDPPVYIDPMGTGMYGGGAGMNGKSVGIAVGAVGAGALVVGVGAIALTADGDLNFGHEPEPVNTKGTGGCVAGSCGGGVGWGGGGDDSGGTTGACGGGGGSCSAADGGAGCSGGCGGGCGGCGG